MIIQNGGMEDCAGSARHFEERVSMRAMMQAIGCGFMLAIAPTPGAAEPGLETARMWLKSCSSKEGSATYIACMNYLRGFGEANEVNPAGKAFCYPEGFTGGQAVALYVKYVNDHPEYQHLSFPLMVLKMMTHYFPCGEAPMP